MRRNVYIASLLAVGSLAAVGQDIRRPIVNAEFGRVGDTSVQIYTLTNVHGIEARIMTYGATLVSLKTPDRAGRLDSIILGFDGLDAYLAGVPYFGATVGRYANRIANGRFTLDGKSYQLPQNNAPNSLHGGKQGFDKRIWTAEPMPTPPGSGLRGLLWGGGGGVCYLPGWAAPTNCSGLGSVSSLPIPLEPSP